MMQLETYLHKTRRGFAHLAVDSRVVSATRVALLLGVGLAMSAASLGGRFTSLSVGLVCALVGWRAGLVALGGAIGYLLFWGAAGAQGVVWMGVSFVASLLVGRRAIAREAPLLMAAISALIVSATGLGMQLLYFDTTPVSAYLMRVAVAGASTYLYQRACQRDSPLAVWLAQGTLVLALAQVAPAPWLSAGMLAGALISMRDGFPAAVIAGLALDLAHITPTPMAAVLAVAYLARLIPMPRRALCAGAPCAVYLLVMSATGTMDSTPLIPLALGGCVAVLLPRKGEENFRRGETGTAQVRLELMAGALGEMERLLLAEPLPPADEAALLARTRERACGTCPHRKQCPDHSLPADLLHRKLGDVHSLPFPCRKAGRMVQEIERSREQLRLLNFERAQTQACRNAVAQQYRFLAEYLRKTSDELPRRARFPRQRYEVDVAICSAGKHSANGDRCASFLGTACKHYVLLCDGMGTGSGAAVEGQSALSLLKNMLMAGLPASFALRSFNSLLTLRAHAGAATVDLAEIDLTSGCVALYKWGASPSWVLRANGTEQIGTATVPPGLSVTDVQETTDRLSLRRGEALALCSDGVDAQAILRYGDLPTQLPSGELAAKLLQEGGADSDDDATCAVVRLKKLTV